MYVIIELQKAADGTVAVPPINTASTLNAARSTFYTICASAAISSVPVHSVAVGKVATRTDVLDVGYGLSVDGAVTLAEPLARSYGGTGSASYGSTTTTDVSTAVSVASGSWVSIGSLTLGEGMWLVTYGGYFAVATNGLLRMCISTESSSPTNTNLRHFGISVDTSSSNDTTNYKPIHAATWLNLSESATYKLFAWQNSGSARNCVGSIRAFRLR